MNNKPIELHAKQKLSVPQQISSFIEDKIMSCGSLIEKELPPLEFMLEPWLTTTSMTVINAPRGLGKSQLSIQIAVAVSSATEFCGWEAPKAHRVLFIDGEMGLHETQERMKFMTYGLPQCEENLFVMCDASFVQDNVPPPNYAKQNYQEGFVEYIRHNPNVKLVIFDNKSCLFRDIDENNKKEWDSSASFLRSLKHLGVAVILIHHTGKDSGKGGRGASSVEDQANNVIQLHKLAGHKQEHGCRFRLAFNKGRGLYGEDAKDLIMELHDINERRQLVLSEGTHKQAEIMRMHRQGMKVVEIEKTSIASKGYISQVIKQFDAEEKFDGREKL